MKTIILTTYLDGLPEFLKEERIDFDLICQIDIGLNRGEYVKTQCQIRYVGINDIFHLGFRFGKFHTKMMEDE